MVGKKILGGFAAGVIPLEVRDYAFKTGFYVMELTGESVALLDTPEDFELTEWQ
jgi:hypothetical protein